LGSLVAAAGVFPVSVVPDVKVALEMASEDLAYAVGSADEELLDTEIAEPVQVLAEEPDIVSEVARKEEEEDLVRD